MYQCLCGYVLLVPLELIRAPNSQYVHHLCGFVLVVPMKPKFIRMYPLLCGQCALCAAGAYVICQQLRRQHLRRQHLRKAAPKEAAPKAAAPKEVSPVYFVST